MSSHGIEIATPILLLVLSPFGAAGMLLTLIALLVGIVAASRDSALTVKNRWLIVGCWLVTLVGAFAVFSAYAATENAVAAGTAPPGWTNVMYPAIVVALVAAGTAEVRVLRRRR